MSDEINDNLIERAVQVMAYFEGTDLETAIMHNIDTNDLDRVRYLVVNGEAEMSRQEFHTHDAL